MAGGKLVRVVTGSNQPGGQSSNPQSGMQSRPKRPRIKRLRGKRTLAKKAYEISKQNSKMISALVPELKYIQNNIGYSVDWVGNAGVLQYTLNATNNGTTDVTRVGDNIRLQTLFMNYRVELGATPTNCSIRLFIVLDKDNEVTGPTVLITDTATLYAPLGMEFWDDQEKVRILWSKTIDLDTVSNPFENGSLKLNLRNMLTAYSAAGSDPIINRLRFMAVSNIDSAAAAATKPVVYAVYRTVFTDV